MTMLLEAWLSVAQASRLAGWHLGAEQGLPLGHAVVATEDAAGFLWVGNQGGLARFDGERFQPVGQDVVDGTVNDLVALPDGDLLAVADIGLFRVRGLDVERLPQPEGDWIWPQACARDGVVWLSSGRALYRAEMADPLVWERQDVPFRAHGVSCDGGAFAKAGPEAWERADGRWQRLVRLSESSVLQVIGAPDGERWVLPWSGPLRRVRDDLAVPLSPQSRNQGLVERHGAIWATSGDLLARVDPSGRVDRFGPPAGIVGIPDLYVGDEGDLWTVSDNGLTRYPEPDTVRLAEEDGVRGGGQLSLRADGPWVWSSGWGGLSRVDAAALGSRSDPGVRRRVVASGTGPGAADPAWPTMRGTVCPTADGAWAVGLTDRGTELVRIRDGVPAPVALLEPTPTGGSCAVDRDGRVWVMTNGSGRLWRVVDGEPRPSGVPLPEVGGLESLHGVGGEVWLADDETVCRLDEPRWTCTTLSGARELGALLKVDGALWVATRWRGIVAVEGGEVRELGVPPGGPAARRITGLSASPRGGVWLAGVGRMVRARWDDARGWEVLERLAPSQGIVDGTASDLLELADGTVLAAQGGVLVVPPEVRERALAPPRLVLREVDTDGQPLAPGGTVSWRHNRVELRLAAPSYHDRADLRLRYRVRDGDPFVETRQLGLSLADLAPGAYRVTAQASFDGARWSEPVAVGFVVEAPPWRRWWAIGGAGLALVGLGYALHRSRLARELALERERTRIALDLHDDLGSALGTVKLAAKLLESDAIGEHQRHELAERLVRQSGDVMSALTDIVWSLRSGPADPEALLDHLEDRGRGLVGRDAQLVVLRPTSWPRTRFAPDVARAAAQIGLEALHNASKHARAEVIVLRLAPVGRGRWLLEVADDGIGLRGADGPRPGGGAGLEGMRRRAERLGAALDIGSDREGTRVSLTFRER